MMIAKGRKTRQRRAEGLWTAVIGGTLGVCLLVAGTTKIPLVPFFANALKSAQIGSQPGTGPGSPSPGGNAVDDDDIRTGSIVVQIRRDDCEQRLFDNYTGRIWVMGTVSCEAALSRGRESKSGPERVQTISNAFRSAR